jgi:hypothetical protein
MGNQWMSQGTNQGRLLLKAGGRADDKIFFRIRLRGRIELFCTLLKTSLNKNGARLDRGYQAWQALCSKKFTQSSAGLSWKVLPRNTLASKCRQMM